MQSCKHKQEVAHVIMENKIPHVKVLKKEKRKTEFHVSIFEWHS
jgi:hypothetical protein